MRERFQVWLRRWQETRFGRAWEWYNFKTGPVLCQGIAYSTLFSLFAALTIGWTVFSLTLGRDPALRDGVLAQIGQWLPGLVGDGPDTLLNPDDLIMRTGFSIAGIIASGVLLYTATGVVEDIRDAVRAMFDMPAANDTFIKSKLYALVGFGLLAFWFLATGLASVATDAIDAFTDLHVGDSLAERALVQSGFLLLNGIADLLIVLGLIRLVAGVRTRGRAAQRDVLLGGLVIAVVAAFLRWAGTSIVVGSAAQDALLAPFAAIVAVLVIVSFLARMLLMVTAWLHNPPLITEDIDTAIAQVRLREVLPDEGGGVISDAELAEAVEVVEAQSDPNAKDPNQSAPAPIEPSGATATGLAIEPSGATATTLTTEPDPISAAERILGN